MSNIAKFKKAGLPAVEAMKDGLVKASAKVQSNAGLMILKMDRLGDWIYGPENLPVDDGVLVAFNPSTFQHGGVWWEDGKIKDEQMVPVTAPDPWYAEGLAEAPGDWSQQMSVEGVLVGGPDDGEEIIYKTSSLGGLEAIGTLAMEVANALDSDEPEKCVPIVRLGNTFYQHKKYGKVYKPVLEVVQFITFDDDPHAALGTPKEDEPKAAPVTRRRSRRG